MSRGWLVSSNVPRKGILEKITDGWAVILVDPDERELALDADQVPPEISPGDAVLIEMDGDQVTGLRRDADRTARRRLRLRAEMDLLRQRRKRMPE